MTPLDTIAGVAQRGTLYGIGVGPGDVRYMTLRAAGLVRSVDVVAFFAKRGREGNARKIVAPLLDGKHRDLRLEYPVTDEIPTHDPEYARTITGFYREASEALGRRVAGGPLCRTAGGRRSLFLRFVHAHVAAPRRRRPH